ncbi:MAG: oxidoreductase domain protein [Chloroflexi bacterium]|nr:oxidoreductase domain protein [Chloroflexota bacterium]
MTVLPTNAQLRVAVIGYGGWGKVHLEAYRSNPLTQLAALCGRDPERVAKTATCYSAHPYTNIGQMLEAERPDLVSVILPDAKHFEPTLQVLEAGIPCFAEKPLTMDLGEAERLLAVAKQRGVRFGINFNHRYSTPFQRAKAYVDGGKLGRPAYFLWKFTGGHFPEGQPSLQHLLYMQSHGFDMLRWLGGPVREVSALGADPRGEGLLTTATVLLSFASGAVGTLIASVDGSYADPHNHEFECLGLGGRIRVTGVLRRFEWSPRASREGTTIWEPGFFDDRARDFAATTATHIDRFVRAQLAGEPVPVPAEDGLEALKLGLAAIESAQTGRRVLVESSS